MVVGNAGRRLRCNSPVSAIPSVDTSVKGILTYVTISARHTATNGRPTVMIICRNVEDIRPWWLRVLGNGDRKGTYVQLCERYRDTTLAAQARTVLDAVCISITWCGD